MSKVGWNRWTPRPPPLSSASSWALCRALGARDPEAAASTPSPPALGRALYTCGPPGGPRRPTLAASNPRSNARRKRPDVLDVPDARCVVLAHAPRDRDVGGGRGRRGTPGVPEVPGLVVDLRRDRRDVLVDHSWPAALSPDAPHARCPRRGSRR